jgi:pectinesterase inhibitor-like protein
MKELEIMSPPFSLFNLLFIFISFSTSPYSAAAKSHNAPRDLVRSSCVHASYPNLCLRTLSSYAGPANTPRDLAQAAVKVSIARARKVSNYLSTLSGLKKKRERVALSDCIEQIYDSVDELSKTLGELKHLREETFGWQMSNAQTWVSAALTNEDTCLDGFHEVESKAKDDVKRKITNVARVTSNALYMINRLDESRGRPKLGRH